MKKGDDENWNESPNRLANRPSNGVQLTSISGMEEAKNSRKEQFLPSRDVKREVKDAERDSVMRIVRQPVDGTQAACVAVSTSVSESTSPLPCLHAPAITYLLNGRLRVSKGAFPCAYLAALLLWLLPHKGTH